jgi:hypothetical protein
MIFSNKFPHLKSCSLTSVYSPSFEVRQLSWSQSPSLHSLHISSHDSLIHVAILNACPNLYFLDLTLYQLDYTPFDIKPHRNLKRLKFILNNSSCLWDETIFEAFFLSIPYLEQLSIQRSIEVFDNFLQFDWLAKILTRQLLFLQKFIFCLHCDKIDKHEVEKNICQIEKNFVNSFRNDKHYHLQIKMQ